MYFAMMLLAKRGCQKLIMLPEGGVVILDA
jgi:hypothetical protein